MAGYGSWAGNWNPTRGVTQMPFPQSGGLSRGYYQPGSLYGAQQSMFNTPIVSGNAGYFAEQPQAAYTRFTSPFAAGEDPFSRFVRNQYGNAYQGFQAALGTNPNLNFMTQYLPGLGGEQYFRNRFQSQAPQLRGEQPGTLGGGRLRWFLNR